MKSMILFIASLVFSIFIFGMVLWQWRRYGAVEGEKTSTFAVSGEKVRLPQIYALNRRVLQNEKIAVAHLAKASDVDGSDLSEELFCYNERGVRLTGMLDTSCPGELLLYWEVKSQITGRRCRKRMTVLVDGRVCP